MHKCNSPALLSQIRRDLNFESKIHDESNYIHEIILEFANLDAEEAQLIDQQDTLECFKKYGSDPFLPNLAVVEVPNYELLLGHSHFVYIGLIPDNFIYLDIFGFLSD